ncbi:MAG: PspA/IM30 family protein [Deltaproteobacteria bacterium]|nr:PspA/IM30 family protein [Deltaproteobacteria bacterium]
MGLFQRIGDLLRSNINDLISRAEDPEKLLHAAIEDMQRQLIEAKSKVAMSIADEKRLQKQHEVQTSRAQEWEKKAMAAVKASRDDLAVEALAKKREHESAALQFEQQLAQQRAAVDALKKALTELGAKIEDTRRRRSILLARAKRAEAQRHIAETLSASKDNSALDRLAALEARVERDEAEAEATWEIAAVTSNPAHQLEKEIQALESSNVQEDLAALKDKMRNMGMIEAKASAHQDDLAELKQKMADAEGAKTDAHGQTEAEPEPPVGKSP